MSSPARNFLVSNQVFLHSVAIDHNPIDQQIRYPHQCPVVGRNQTTMAALARQNDWHACRSSNWDREARQRIVESVDYVDLVVLKKTLEFESLPGGFGFGEGTNRDLVTGEAGFFEFLGADAGTKECGLRGKVRA